MTLEIKIPDSIPMDRNVVEFRAFLQALANRYAVGSLRYGPPQKKQRYMSRLEKEFAAYKKSGNFEQLLNVAVYAFLESAAPEHKNLHFDPAIDSITRGEFGLGR